MTLGVVALALFVIMSASARGVSETFAVFLLPVSADLGWSRAEANSIYALGIAGAWRILTSRWAPV